MAMVAACVSAHVPEMSGGRGALFRHSPANAPSRPIILDWERPVQHGARRRERGFEARPFIQSRFLSLSDFSFQTSLSSLSLRLTKDAEQDRCPSGRHYVCVVKKSSFGVLVNSPGTLSRTINIDRLQITLVYARCAAGEGLMSFRNPVACQSRPSFEPPEL